MQRAVHQQPEIARDFRARGLEGFVRCPSLPLPQLSQNGNGWLGALGCLLNLDLPKSLGALLHPLHTVWTSDFVQRREVPGEMVENANSRFLGAFISSTRDLSCQ